jgi:hypothetical protein
MSDPADFDAQFSDGEKRFRALAAPKRRKPQPLSRRPEPVHKRSPLHKGLISGRQKTQGVQPCDRSGFLAPP